MKFVFSLALATVLFAPGFANAVQVDGMSSVDNQTMMCMTKFEPMAGPNGIVVYCDGRIIELVKLPGEFMMAKQMTEFNAQLMKKGLKLISCESDKVCHFARQ